MDYSYNYRFLSEFREENKLSKRDLLEALGSSDYTGINRWLDGKTPIHLTAMLRLCNYYNIPMSRFFFDADGESTLHILPPEADSQTTPTDDYGINNTAGKSIIETHITTRLISSQSQERMVTKGLLEKDRYYVGGAAANHGDTMGTVPAVSSDSGLQRDCPHCVPGSSEPMPESEAILRLKLEHANELRQLERDSHEREDRIRRDCQAQFDAERNRLMDIIERQNAELAKLYNEGKEGVK